MNWKAIKYANKARFTIKQYVMNSKYNTLKAPAYRRMRCSPAMAAICFSSIFTPLPKTYYILTNCCYFYHFYFIMMVAPFSRNRNQKGHSLCSVTFNIQLCTRQNIDSCFINYLAFNRP